MRILYPVNEFNDVGYSSLALSIFLSEKLVLWSPMALYLDELYRKGISILNSNHILNLVESGYIQIAGRETWFDKTYRNNMTFPKARYTHFDTQLLYLMDSTQVFESINKPIFIAPKQKGGKWANKVLSTKTFDNLKIIDTAQELLRNFEIIPLGIQDKLLNKSAEEQLKLLIQIIKNTFNSIEETQSNNIIYWDSFFDKALLIANYKPNKENNYEFNDVHSFLEMCDYLNSLIEVNDYKSYIASLEKRDTFLVKQEISKILSSSLSVGESYLLWYEEMIVLLERKKRDFIKKLLVDSCLTIPGLLVFIIDILINNNNPFSINIGLSSVMNNISNTAAIAGTSKFAYDIIRNACKIAPDKAPILPFLGTKLIGKARKKDYLEKIRATKQMIY